MKICVYYNQNLLGKLEKKEGCFVYNVAEGEGQVVKKYMLEFSEYGDLVGAKNLKSKKLFDFFSEVCNQIRKRTDLKVLAKISDDDDDFDVLSKYATLTQFNQKFHFAIEN